MEKKYWLLEMLCKKQQQGLERVQHVDSVRRPIKYSTWFMCQNVWENGGGHDERESEVRGRYENKNQELSIGYS